MKIENTQEPAVAKEEPGQESGQDAGKMSVTQFPDPNLMPADSEASSSTNQVTATPPAMTAAVGDTDPDEAGTATSSKRRQIVLKFAFTYRRVPAEVCLENGDIDTTHHQISAELTKKLMELDIARKMKKREFLTTQRFRVSGSGTVHKKGRVVTWEVTCSVSDKDDIKKKLSGLHLYGGPISLMGEFSDTDSASDTSSSSESYSVSYSDKELEKPLSEHSSSSPAKRQRRPTR